MKTITLQLLLGVTFQAACASLAGEVQTITAAASAKSARSETITIKSNEIARVLHSKTFYSDFAGLEVTVGTTSFTYKDGELPVVAGPATMAVYVRTGSNPNAVICNH